MFSTADPLHSMCMVCFEHVCIGPSTLRWGCHAASASIAVAVKLPALVDWAKLDTLAAEERVMLNASTSPLWKPVVSRTPRCDPDPLSRFCARGVYHNTSRRAGKPGTVRAVLGKGPNKSVPATVLQHTCYEVGFTFPYEEDRVDVRFLQLMRDVSHLLHAGAFEGRQPEARVNVHAATVVLLNHLGFTAAVPLGVLLVLYVWAFATVQHPVFRKKRGSASKPWHAAVASGLGEAWTRLQLCDWHEDVDLSAMSLSVLAALPRSLLLRHEGGFDRSVWTQLLDEGFCSEVCSDASMLSDTHVLLGFWLCCCPHPCKGLVGPAAAPWLGPPDLMFGRGGTRWMNALHMAFHHNCRV